MKTFQLDRNTYEIISQKISHDDLMTKTYTHCKSCTGEQCSFYHDGNDDCMDWIEQGIIPDCVNWNSPDEFGNFEFYTFHIIEI